MKTENIHLANIQEMYTAIEDDRGFDVIIVVSSSCNQAEFWQERLDASKAVIAGRKAQIISVEEDWLGGAGQLLGTLYAFEKAGIKLNLREMIANGARIAMYHTAGKGTRMAPLPAVEANNKSAIKLPRTIEINGTISSLTVLEAVIFQTCIFAASRPGRLCVFWGDQVFIPAKTVDFGGTHHAEILNIRGEIPLHEETWRRDWQSYGLIIPMQDGDALQREKQSWSKIKGLISNGIVKPDESGKTILGKSLGCFSISHVMLSAMLDEFAPELETKQAKMDTDPHLWMPLTSTREEFISGGGDETLWERINKFKYRFPAQGLRRFGDKDMGSDTLWWDYGQVRLYHQNSLKALEDSFEGECLRHFYNLEGFQIKNSTSDDLAVENSIVVNTQAKGRVKNSILMNVMADDIDICESVIINSALSGVQANNTLIYDCVDIMNIKLDAGDVLTNICLPSQGRVSMKTTLWRDGKEDWESIIPGNTCSFETLNGLVGDKPVNEFECERGRWMVYYENRKSLQALKHRFIKPSLDNLVEVVWGGNHIERMKGLPPSGRNIGESWECSTHPQHPSKVKLSDGLEIPLNDLICLMGKEALGSTDANQGLPLLVKFLDARKNLSVQVHPSDEKAKELGEYDTGKTEVWLVLDAEPGAVLYLGFKDDVDRSAFERDLSSPDVNIAEKYLNAIPAKVGDVLMNPTGTIHAIGKGVVLAEIQQSSGITYRVWDWNRIPQRPLHIAQAMESLDFQKTTKADFQLSPRRLNQREERLIDTFYFTVDRLTLDANDELDANTEGGFQVLLCLKGKVQLVGADSREQLSRWESLLVPAALGEYRIVAEEDSVLLKSFVLTPQQIDPVIFQTYDVRAVADQYLSDRVCYYLGKGYGTFLRREIAGSADDPTPTVAIGGGVRLSTERIRHQVIEGILSTGVNVYDVGITSTPELYFSIPYLNVDGGVNITASHNESEYNGLKQVICSKDGFITSINAEQMLEIKRTVIDGDFIEGKGEYTKIEEGEVVRYHNELVKANCRLGREIWIYLLRQWEGKGLKTLLDATSKIDFPEGSNDKWWAKVKEALDLPPDFTQPDTAIKHPFEGLKVVIDFGNGSAWRTGEVYSDLGAQVVALNETPDGSFPAHIPDPIKARYRKQLEETVIREALSSPKEVVGIGNDEDADRVIYVRSDGRVVEGDRTLAIQAKVIIEEHRREGRPGKPRFIGEVKFSRVAEEYVTALGGEYILSPTGFAFIKDGTRTLTRALRSGEPEVDLFGHMIDLRENRQPVALAAELSGHQMSGHEENWIFDDSLLAASKLLTAIARGLKEGKTFIDLDEEVPRYPVTPELNIRLKTNILAEKQEMVDAVISIFRQKGYPIDITDGGLIKWIDADGRWLGQALIRKSNTQPMIICRVEGKNEQTLQKIEDEFFKDLSNISTGPVPKLDLTSDDYIRGILPRVLEKH